MTPQTYKLRTLADVFEQIPSDRIELCLREIAYCMVQAKGIGELGGVPLEWCEVCEWVDDGMGVVTTDVLYPDGAKVTVESKPAETHWK